MGTWLYPPIDITSKRNWLWRSQPHHGGEQFAAMFDVQKYASALGVVRNLVIGNAPEYYRIVTKIPPQHRIAVASSRERIDDMVEVICTELLPRVIGLSNEQFHTVLPTVMEKLAHRNTLELLKDWNLVEEGGGIVPIDLSTVIEGIKSDSLMMSITFEYNYKYPPPDSLLCHTCGLPAVDPYVSPFFLGKVFCAACKVFEGGGSNKSYFLKAANIAAELDSLEVYCPFKDFGCEVCLPRGQLGAHLEECPFIRIVCLNKQYGCKFGAKSRKEAIEHMQVCEFSSAIWHDIAESSNRPTDPRNPSYPLPATFPNTLKGVIDAAHTKDHQEPPPPPSDKCVNCGAARKPTDPTALQKSTDEFECTFHSGTWNGYSYEQVQDWRYAVWRHRLTAGVKTVVHLPIEIAKSTTALGVGVVSFGALAGALTIIGLPFLPEALLIGGFFMFAAPVPTTFIAITTLSYVPSMLYRAVYTIPYEYLWGKSKPKEEEQPTKWTCCNQIGSSAPPCEKHGLHTFTAS